MKMILAAAALSAAFIASPALAQSNQSVGALAVIPKTCAIANIGDISMQTTVDQSSGATALRASQNGTTGSFVGFQASCNSDVNITVTSANGGLTNGGTPTPAAAPSGFTNVIEYTVGITGIGAAISLNTASATTTGPQLRGPFLKNGTNLGTQAIFGAELNSGQTTPPVAGTYSDTVTVDFTLV
jgi:hypothetical protein